MSGKLVLPDIWLFSDLSFQWEAPNATRTPSQWIVTIVCAIRWIPASPRELLRTGVLSLCFSFYFHFFRRDHFRKQRKKLVEFCLPCTAKFTYVSDSVFCLIAILVILTLCILFCFLPKFLMFFVSVFRVPVQLARFIEKWFKIRYWVFISFLGFVFCFALFYWFWIRIRIRFNVFIFIINPMFKLCIYNVIFIIHFKWYLLTSQLFAHIDLIPFIF